MKHIRSFSSWSVKNKYYVYAFSIYALLITDIFRVMFDYHLPQLVFLVAWIRGAQYITVMLCFMPIVYSERHRKSVRLSIFVATAFFLGLLLTLMFASDRLTALAIESLLLLIPRLFPMLYIGLTIDSWEKLVNVINRLCLIASVYALICIIHATNRLELNPLASIHNKYMLISNNLTIPLLMSLLTFIITRKWFSLICSVLPMVFIILYGSRGALARVLVAVIVFLIMQYYHNYRKKVVIGLSIFVSVFALLIVFSKQIATILLSVFPYSRTILMISNGNFLFFDDRMQHLEGIFIELSRAPFAVRGFFADSLINAIHLNRGLDSGLYAHNLFIEYLADFGIIFGGLLILITIAMLVLSFVQSFKGNNSYVKIGYSAVVVALFIQSMVSNSIMDYPYYWLMYGVMIRGAYLFLKCRIDRSNVVQAR